MTTLAVVQARMGSRRLPGKVLAEIVGLPMIAHVVSRVREVVPDVVLAIPDTEENRPLSSWATGAGMIPWVVGPEEDVLRRMLLVAQAYPSVETFLRITADCPMLDSAVIRQVLAFYSHSSYNYVYTGPEMDGLDTEVFSWRALANANLWIRGALREHVLYSARGARGTYRYRFPGIGPLRWSVDDPGGLDFVRRVFALCVRCRVGVPHHSNAASSIGGSDRVPIWDLHAVPVADGVVLEECLAYDLRMTRSGGPVYVG